MQLEFAHYDCKHQGSIPVQDFGSSLVAAASLSNITKYLRRVDALAAEPRFKDIRISFEVNYVNMFVQKVRSTGNVMHYQFFVNVYKMFYIIDYTKIKVCYIRSR